MRALDPDKKAARLVRKEPAAAAAGSAAAAPAGGEGTREDLLAAVDLLLDCLDEVATWGERPERGCTRRVARRARQAEDPLRHAEHEAAEILEHVA